MVNQLWLGGVFMIQGVTDRIGHFVTHRHATGHRAFGGRQRNRSKRRKNSLAFQELWKYHFEQRERVEIVWDCANQTKARRILDASPSVAHFVPACHGEMEFEIGIWNKCVIWEFMGENLCVNLPAINLTEYSSPLHCFWKFSSKLNVDRIHLGQY